MVGRGRQKTVLKLIEKQESRLVCFIKRRSGLFKKASELSILTGAKVGAIVFSPAGKLFALETPTLLLGCPIENDPTSSTESESVDAMVGKEAPFWWNRPQVQAMSFDELLQFKRAMLEYGEKKFGNCSELLLQGILQGGDERTLLDAEPSFSCNDSADPINNSLQMEMEMFPSTLDPNLIFDDQWLQWLDEWLMDAEN